ncbi:MAG: aldehyde dehydrogenase family protein [Elusimicrobiota bacterium]
MPDAPPSQEGFIPAIMVRNHNPVEIAKIFSRARAAQDQWRRYSLTQRVRALRGLWSLVQDSRERVVSVVHGETGKPVAEIESMEIDGAELILKFFTRNAHRILQDQAVPRPWPLLNKRAYVRHVPRGTVGLITPWNMPFLIPFGDAIPALLAGNAVVLKPSEWTTGTALLIEDRVRASGLFPEGLLQVAVGDATVGAQVAHDADMVVFTGSTSAGRKVAAAAAERLVPVVLELGGKHPMIVAEDAPLRRAAKAAVWGGFANCGQLCVGVERVFVEKSVYERFVQAVEAEIAALRQGLNGGYDVDVGRLIVPGQLEVVERHIEDARAKGARVSGGEVLDRKSLLVSPALVLDAKPDMLVMREETFGPVLPIMPVRTVSEAIRLANDGPHGLAASVWTRDLSRGEEWAALLEAGLVSVNDLLSHYVVCSLPFGGFKDSGLGRRHSDEGLRMFCEPQSVLVHEWPADTPELWWFPYDRLKSRILSWLARLS